MTSCPCCSDRLLRHIRQGSLYWFCRTCWSEMPNFASEESDFAMSEPLKVKPLVTSTHQPIHVATSQGHYPSLNRQVAA